MLVTVTYLLTAPATKIQRLWGTTTNPQDGGFVNTVQKFKKVQETHYDRYDNAQEGKKKIEKNVPHGHKLKIRKRAEGFDVVVYAPLPRANDQGQNS